VNIDAVALFILTMTRVLLFCPTPLSSYLFIFLQMFQSEVAHPSEEEKEEETMMDEEALESEDVVGEFPPPKPVVSSTMKNRSRLSTTSKKFDEGNKVSYYLY